MLNIARSVVEYTEKLRQSLNAIGSIVRWDVDELAGELRAISLEAEDRGLEDVSVQVERVERKLRDLGAILAVEKDYSTRAVLDLEDELEEDGIPISRAFELERAVDHVSLLMELNLDSSLEEAIDGWPELESAWDEVLEALMDLQIKLVLQTDELDPEPAPFSTPYDWEAEDDFEPEQDGLTVVSYDEFADEWFGLNGDGDPDDVIDRIASRTTDLKTALDALASEIPFSVGADIESAINQTYDSAEALEELLLG